MSEIQGGLSLVLHAHLPFVRHPEHPSFLEEDWLFEAITETYIPLLNIFTRLAESRVPFRLTMSITPTLCEMLNDNLLMERYQQRLVQLQKLTVCEVERTAKQPEFQATALMYAQNIAEIVRSFEHDYNQDLLLAFKQLQDAGYLEIITCAATHGFLPLFASSQCVRGQLRMAVKNYERHFERSPTGIWLPECGYYEGLEEELAAVGLKYSFLDSHGILFSSPRPKNGVFSPVLCRNGVALFGRDIESSRQVWSSEVGYPGDSAYREFYRDLGYDADENYIKPYLHNDGIRRNLGIKYYRVTGKNVPLTEKQPYDYALAMERAAEHAGNFMFNRQCQVRHLAKHLACSPLIVSPYDAELFGHWWFEGPAFLDFLLRKLCYDQDELTLTTPAAYLSQAPDLQVVTPAASSWGDKGYFEVWLNGSNDWMYRHLHQAGRLMIKFACKYRDCTGDRERILNQMARELMLAQASDWAFIMTTDTMVEYAQKRIRDHISRFKQLCEMLENASINPDLLLKIEHCDNIFAEMDFRIYSN